MEKWRLDRKLGAFAATLINFIYSLILITQSATSKFTQTYSRTSVSYKLMVTKSN